MASERLERQMDRRSYPPKGILDNAVPTNGPQVPEERASMPDGSRLLVPGGLLLEEVHRISGPNLVFLVFRHIGVDFFNDRFGRSGVPRDIDGETS